MTSLAQLDVSTGKLPETGPHWYAIHTRVRHEKQIELRFRQVGMDSFLPLVKEVHRWSDRRKEVSQPLFPGYMFVRLAGDAAMRLVVLKTPGVLNFVGNRPQNSIVSDQEIEQVRAVVTQQNSFFPAPFLQTGQRVRIRGGVLDGVEGILSSHTGAATLVISVNLIQRSVSLSLNGYDIEAA